MLTKFRNKLRFPRLGIAVDAIYDIHGQFNYGRDCSIGTRAVLIIPSQATLSLGDGVYIGRQVEVGPGGYIHIGDLTSVQDRSIFLGDVRIGRYCLFSLNVLVTSGTHYYDTEPDWLIRDQDEYVRSNPRFAAQLSKPVEIGDDCWIGANSVILAGVTIGKGCVVGANSVVKRDLPPYSVAVGAPARVVKQRMLFLPPRTLDARSETSLPYFYSGFGISAKERETGFLHGGLLAQSNFSVALDVTDSREIVLTARSLGSACEIRCGEVALRLSQEFSSIRFPLTSDMRSPLRFSATDSERSKWPACISEVSVK